MTTKSPKIEPIQLTEYTVKQSKYEVAGKTPIRDILLGPSGVGKSVLLSNMILDIYRDCFDRIYLFSPSINVDHTWQPVKSYIEKNMKVQHTDKEPIYFDHYDPEALNNIIDTQHKITKHLKDSGKKQLFQILIVIDDFADDPTFSRQSKILHSLFTRGRHNFISTLVSTQAYRALHPIIRLNAIELFIFRLRNFKDIEAVIEETSAIVDKNTLMDMYKLATSEPFSFLYIKLSAKKKEDMFYIRYDKKLVVED